MDDTQRETQKLGARTALNATGAFADELAADQGLTILPGEDLIACVARQRGVTREVMFAYFSALAEGGDPHGARSMAIIDVSTAVVQ